MRRNIKRRSWKKMSMIRTRRLFGLLIPLTMVAGCVVEPAGYASSYSPPYGYPAGYEATYPSAIVGGTQSIWSNRRMAGVIGIGSGNGIPPRRRIRTGANTQGHMRRRIFSPTGTKASTERRRGSFGAPNPHASNGNWTPGRNSARTDAATIARIGATIAINTTQEVIHEP